MAETATKEPSTSSLAPQKTPARKGRFPLRLISSTCIITVLLFALLNLAVEKFDPLEHLYWTGLTGTRQHIFVSKLPRLLSSPDPDVLLLGSSVSLYPAVRADDALAGKKARWDFWYERSVILPYDKAVYLQHQLSDAFGHPVSVSNASVAGSLISDQDLILKKYLYAGKKAKLVILCLSPRDFMDRLRTDLESTPTHNVLKDLKSIPEILSEGGDWRSVAFASLGNLSNYFSHRQEYSHFLTHLAARQLNRPVNLFEATSEKKDKPPVVADKKDGKRDNFFNPVNKPVYKASPNTLYHLDEYKAMYLPINREQLASQTKSFNSFLRRAQESDIPVLIVRTPLPVENTGLLPPAILQKYEDILNEGCRKHGAALLEPDAKQPYDTAKDFEDASHMNTSGGIKFYKSIAEFIQNESIVSSKLARKSQ